MPLTLDHATEARLQRELAAGPYNEPSELLAHALDLIEDERAGLPLASEHTDDWLSRNKEAVRAMIDESVASEARGESYSMEEAEAILAQRRTERAANRAA